MTLLGFLVYTRAIVLPQNTPPILTLPSPPPPVSCAIAVLTAVLLLIRLGLRWANFRKNFDMRADLAPVTTLAITTSSMTERTKRPWGTICPRGLWKAREPNPSTTGLPSSGSFWTRTGKQVSLFPCTMLISALETLAYCWPAAHTPQPSGHWAHSLRPASPSPYCGSSMGRLKDFCCSHPSGPFSSQLLRRGNLSPPMSPSSFSFLVIEQLICPSWGKLHVLVLLSCLSASKLLF